MLMTTIAYKDGIIAYDSRATRSNTIISDKANKKEIINGVVFIYCGATCDFENFVKCYFNKEIPSSPIEVSAYVLDKNYSRLYCVGIEQEDKYIFKIPMPFDIPDAMGSGEAYALTAMDMGCSAKEAVKWAMKRDFNTGGKINTLNVYKFFGIKKEN